MDRRTRLWRGKSLEKSPGESESSGSLSSFSERCLDDQIAEFSSVVMDNAVNTTVKSLAEKLSAALLDITTKEDLVKQHAKVAEEAVSGWEMAEAEAAALKKQLEASSQKNSILEDRIGHLEEALNECTRQLRQSSEEQEQKVQVELESQKSQLVKQLDELYAQIEITKSESLKSIDENHRSRIEALEEQKESLKAEILALSEQLHICTLEREIIAQAAESASKNHLESMKKATMLESECRRLHALACRASSTRHQKPIPSSLTVEYLKDSQTDSFGLLPGEDGEEVSSDSWQPALIPEFGFKDGKVCPRDLIASKEFDLMDDFLDMERLVALPCRDFAREESLRNELEAVQLLVAEFNNKMQKMEDENVQLELILTETRNQLEASYNQLSLAGEKMVDLQRQLDLANQTKHTAIDGKRPPEELNEKIEIKSTRKELQSQLNSAYVEAEEEIETLSEELETQLMLANSEIEKLNKKIALLEHDLNEERQLSAKQSATAAEAEAARCSLESELELTDSEIGRLHIEMQCLQAKFDKEREVATQFTAKCHVLEEELSRTKHEAELCQIRSSHAVLKLNKDKELAEAAGKLADCQKTIASLGQQLKSLTMMHDFISEDEKGDIDGCIQCFSSPESRTCRQNGSSEDGEWLPSPSSWQ